MKKHIHMVKLMKLLTKLQPLPHHLCLPHAAEREPSRAIKLVRFDGSVQIFHRPVRVSDLMQQFPKHMVCSSGSFYIGQKVPFLSENEKLKLGHDYFLLPHHFFQSVLSFVTITALSSENEAAKQISLKSSFKPFHIQKGPSGCLQIRVTDEFMSQIMTAKAQKHTDEEVSGEGKVCTSGKLKKDYDLLVGMRRRWKPKLETITETEKEKRKRVSTPKRKKNKKKKSGDQIFAGKMKMKFKSRKLKLIKFIRI